MKPIGIDHFANFAFLNHLKVSDSGKAAFLIKRANLEENGYDSDLYFWRDGQPVQLTDTGKVSDFYWVGEELYFPAVRKKADQEYVKKGLPSVAASQTVKGNPKEREFLNTWVNVVDYQ